MTATNTAIILVIVMVPSLGDLILAEQKVLLPQLVLLQKLNTQKKIRMPTLTLITFRVRIVYRFNIKYSCFSTFK